MKKFNLFWFFLFSFGSLQLAAQDSAFIHPETSGKGWAPLFNGSLSNAIYPKGVWTVTDGVLTADKDEAIWSDKTYDDFVLDLDLKNAPGTNSGVVVHASDMKDWI